MVKESALAEGESMIIFYCVKIDQDTILPSILRQPIDENKRQKFKI